LYECLAHSDDLHPLQHDARQSCLSSPSPKAERPAFERNLAPFHMQPAISHYR
jgi:hypothetical protein